MQKDYSFVDIHIYPDKVLIYNDGRLPESWSVEDLFMSHTSKPYNPLIAGSFFRSGQIEAWGRGIEKITEACKSLGKPKPYYRIRANEVMIGFYTDNGIVKNIVENIVENIEANAVQKKIMVLMQENPRITAKLIADRINIATRNVQVHIRSLKEMGLVWRVGAARGGYWVVKQP